jgi:DNA-binding beta-propeller fold protein YncE
VVFAWLIPVDVRDCLLSSWGSRVAVDVESPSSNRENAMNTKRCAGALALAAAVVLSSSFWCPDVSAQSAQPPLNGPQFEVDPSWPKPLPERWVTGELGGVCVDANDHVFVLSRPNLYPGIEEIAQPAPPVMEFDQTGNVVNSWGNRQSMADALHGCSFDAQGNIWIAGNNDGFIQKYSHDGKLLLQIGVKGKVDSADGKLQSRFLNASPVAFYSPTQVAVDPANGDLFVADGYGNKRVAVFDKAGKFLRQWGRQGTTAEAAAGVGGAFVNIVHCVVLGNDGLVYVCDRNGDRIQVFDKTGAFKRNIPVPGVFRPSYTGNGTVGNVVFSRDPDQKHMFIGDFSNKLIRVFDRVSGKELSRFGRPGSHQIGGRASTHGIPVD